METFLFVEKLIGNVHFIKICFLNGFNDLIYTQQILKALNVSLNRHFQSIGKIIAFLNKTQ